MEGLCLRTSGDFGGTLERVYGERVSGGEGGLERVSTGSLGPGTEIHLYWRHNGADSLDSFFLYIFYVRSSVSVYSTDQSYVQYSMFFLYFNLKRKKEESWGVTVRTLVSDIRMFNVSASGHLVGRPPVTCLVQCSHCRPHGA